MLDRKSLLAAAVAVCCALPVTVTAVPHAHADAPTQAQTHARTQARTRLRNGAVIAHLWVKRMRLKVKVRTGVSEAVLRRGVGHYPGTARPGQEGNTVLLGHRTTWLRPFNQLDRMRRGDRIVLRVGRTSYVYRVRSRHVIDPRNRSVLEPVPFRPRSAPHGRYVTLISCTPKGSDRWRLVVVGTLDR
ncbi:LPXTG-site transpeptidase (sortase) family protein [Actinomadura pelletieri DSM 43383]|uniref:LPXTG-site transpeptidase (Sortase) family protein n=1 Tax=Actinomadura pelletieri DSM 43383 TaxID=1120940 RepID=A0A495R0K1_9ACTN|nr:class E sortase [Actinomadura pelletieri]RKS79838.1 LPXTG-site transpeptidase (sortase) family protein [Actinomadura pelletieri DSM 43383]